MHICNLVFDSSHKRCIKLFIHTFIDMHSFVFIWLAISRKIWNCMKWWSLDRKVRGKIGTLKIMFTLRDVTPPFCYSGMNEDSYWPSFSHLSHLLPFSLFLTDAEISNKNVGFTATFKNEMCKYRYLYNLFFASGIKQGNEISKTFY